MIVHNPLKVHKGSIVQRTNCQNMLFYPTYKLTNKRATVLWKPHRQQEIPESESKDFTIAIAVARVLAFSCTNFPSLNSHRVMPRRSADSHM